MIISDLEHLEVVGEENQIEGGVQLVSGSSASASGLATSGRVFISDFASSSAFQSFSRFGSSTGTSASGSSSGRTLPFFFF
ncbi:MAG: hypothetical protein M3O33_21675 [Cyanobacteriota bacterium]|nr:hypothetical protein [Cyanobacteriota bacterium]